MFNTNNGSGFFNLFYWQESRQWDKPHVYTTYLGILLYKNICAQICDISNVCLHVVICTVRFPYQSKTEVVYFPNEKQLRCCQKLLQLNLEQVQNRIDKLGHVKCEKFVYSDMIIIYRTGAYMPIFTLTVKKLTIRQLSVCVNYYVVIDTITIASSLHITDQNKYRLNFVAHSRYFR